MVKGFNMWENYAAKAFEETFGHGTQVADTIRVKTAGIAEAVSHLGRYQGFPGCRCETPEC